MGWFDRIRGLFGRKRRADSPLTLTRYSPAPNRPGGDALNTAYRENPVLRVVERIADEVAKANWRVFHRVDETGKARRWPSHARAAPDIRWREAREAIRRGVLVEQPDHVLVELLASPNEYQDGRELLKLLSLHYDLHGEAFIVVQKVGPYPVGLWAVPPPNVRLLPRFEDPPEKRFFLVVFGRQIGQFPVDQIIHIRNPDPADPLGRGAGTGFALGDSLDTAEYAERFVKTFLWNFGLPPAVIAIEGAQALANSKEAKSFIEDLNAKHKGPDNAGKTLLLPGKVTMARLGTTFEETELLGVLEREEKFVARLYGVPPELRGDTSTSNVASSRAAGAIMAEHVTAPRMEVFRSAFQHRLMPLVDPNGLLDFDSPVPADRDHQLKVATAAPWSRSVNEWRELQDLEPDPKFEGVYPPLAMPGQKVGDVEQAQEEPRPEAPKPKALAGDPAWEAHIPARR